STQTVLGDAWPLATDLPHGVAFHPRQPLAMMVQQAVYDALAGGHDPGVRAATMADRAVRVAIRAVQMVSIVCGMLFVGVACGLARTLARAVEEQGARIVHLATLVLCTQGFMVLFFGYVENYAVVALCIATFLWCGCLAWDGRLPLAVPLVV